MLAEKDWVGGKNCLYKALSLYFKVNIAVFFKELQLLLLEQQRGEDDDRMKGRMGERLESCQ